MNMYVSTILEEIKCIKLVVLVYKIGKPERNFTVSIVHFTGIFHKFPPPPNDGIFPKKLYHTINYTIAYLI